MTGWRLTHGPEPAAQHARAPAQIRPRAPWLGASPGHGCTELLVSALLGLGLQGQLRLLVALTHF